MRLYSPVWIAIAIGVATQVSGGVDLAAKILSGADQAAKSVIDLRGVVPQIGDILFPPKAAKPAAKKQVVKKTP